jgi:hypothetical protein
MILTPVAGIGDIRSLAKNDSFNVKAERHMEVRTRIPRLEPGDFAYSTLIGRVNGKWQILRRTGCIHSQ